MFKFYLSFSLYFISCLFKVIKMALVLVNIYMALVLVNDNTDYTPVDNLGTSTN